jgi:hypothetical protein
MVKSRSITRSESRCSQANSRGVPPSSDAHLRSTLLQRASLESLKGHFGIDHKMPDISREQATNEI